MENLYEILGVEKDVTKEEIKRIYESKLRNHVYENDSEEYIKTKKAYEILVDSRSREEYDERIRLKSEEVVEVEEDKETLYEILGVEVNAEKSDIKKSYATKIRAYSPEKNPKMFQKIKNAYETLINDELREEYNIDLLSSEEIRECKLKIAKAWKSDNYKTIILECKKILILNANLHEYLYKLSRALYYDNKIDEAIKYATELVDMCPRQYEYCKYIATLYMNKEEYTKAEPYLISANEMKPQDETVIEYLIDLYLYSGDYKKAIVFLQNGIDNYTENKHMKSIYCENLIKVYISQGEIDAINQVIDRIENNLVDEDDEKELANKLYEIARDYYKMELYKAAVLIAARSKRLLENRQINELYRKAEHRLNIHDLYNSLEKDSRILDQVKSLVNYYVFSYKYENQDELTRLINEKNREIEILIEKSSEQVLRSMLVLKKYHSELFNYKKSRYEDILKRAEDINKLQEEYTTMDTDVKICLGVYKLVGLLMDDDLTDEQYNISYEEIKKELDSERPQQVYSSVQRIKNRYFKIYDLNPEIIDEIEEKFKPLEKEVKKNNNSFDEDRKFGLGCISLFMIILVLYIIFSIFTKL